MTLTTSVTFGALSRPSATDIPKKSLIIGTYIIDFAAVSPTAVGTAQKTIESSGQDQMFYRSELTTKGLWVNITNGSGVSDILETSETLVGEADINALKLTHWIKADGVTYEIGSGNKKTFSQLNPLSNPLAFDGMAPLDTERDKQIGILKELDDDDDGYDVARNKKAILDSVLGALNSKTYKDSDAKVDGIEASGAKMRQKAGVDESAIHVLDDALKAATIERELLYLNNELALLNNAGERAGTLDYGVLSDQIWTAHGKILDRIRELEGQAGGSEPTNPLEEAAKAAADKLADAAESGNLEAILAAADEQAAADKLALGLVTGTELEIEILTEALDEARNAAILEATKGTSEMYDTAKAMGESKLVLTDMLDEETSTVLEAFENWKDILDMLTGAIEDEVLLDNLLNDYMGALTTALSAIPESDMKPAITDALLDAISESQGDVAAASAEDNAVVQAQIDAKAQQGAQLALLNEAYAEALENGDLSAANAITELAQSFIDESNGDAQAALGAYLEALNAIEVAEAKVNALLGPGPSAEVDGAGDGAGVDGTGDGTGVDGTDDGTGADGIATQLEIDSLTDALDEAKNAALLEAAKGTSEAYDTAKAEGESEAVLTEMLNEETGAVIEVFEDWKDILDTLLAAIDDEDLQETLLDEYKDALTAALIAVPESDMKPEIVDALLAALEESQAAGIGADGTGDGTGADGTDDGTGADGAGADGAGDGTGEEVEEFTVSLADLTAAIAELGEARNELDTIKELLNPEDLQLLDAFSDLLDATILFAEAGNADLTLASVEALEALVPVMPDGFDGQAQLEELEALLIEAKAEIALLGDLIGAGVFGDAQGIIEALVLGDFADVEKDQSAVDVLTGTVIIRADGFQRNGTTYIGVKSLFDQIGGQAVWIPKQRKALGIANNMTLEIVIDNIIAVIGGEETILEGVPVLEDGRSYLPFESASAHIDKFLDERFDNLRVIIVPNLIGE